MAPGEMYLWAMSLSMNRRNILLSTEHDAKGGTGPDRGSLEYIMLSRGVNAKKESFFLLCKHIHFILCKWKSSWGVHILVVDVRGRRRRRLSMVRKCHKLSSIHMVI